MGHVRKNQKFITTVAKTFVLNGAASAGLFTGVCVFGIVARKLSTNKTTEPTEES